MNRAKISQPVGNIIQSQLVDQKLRKKLHSLNSQSKESIGFGVLQSDRDLTLA